MSFMLFIDRGDRYLLPNSIKDEFNSYLKLRREYLCSRIPTLKFPKNINDMPSLLELIESRMKTYKNRDMQVSFLRRIEKGLKEEDQIYLREITEDFQKCVAGDFEDVFDQDRFSMKMWNFLWHREWINLNDKNYSLASFLEKEMKVTGLREIALVHWQQPYPDAVYSAFSFSDNEVVSKNSNIRILLNYGKEININTSNISDEFGNDLQNYFKDSSMRFVDVFNDNDVFYLTSGFSPADMVDTLVHEYGHIYFHSKRTNLFQDSENKFSYKKDTTHDEAFAEFFSFKILSPLYEIYPEIEFSHIVKQSAFSNLRPEDPHYVGHALAYSMSKHETSVIDNLLNVESFKVFACSDDIGLKPIPNTRDLQELRITKEL